MTFGAWLLSWQSLPVFNGVSHQIKDSTSFLFLFMTLPPFRNLLFLYLLFYFATLSYFHMIRCLAISTVHDQHTFELGFACVCEVVMIIHLISTIILSHHFLLSLFPFHFSHS
jgi:hypothetical protein